MKSASLVVLSLLAPVPAVAGIILAEEVSVSERDPLQNVRVHESLLDGMDIHALSPSARFLALPRPMVTRELARAMESGQIKPPTKEWQRIIRKAAKIYGLPEALITSVIKTESSFQAHALSPKGAQGAMQIMPETQEELGLVDPFDPEANVMAGCAYLKRQLDRFGSLELALAAYNAGPANVEKHHGIPPFAETREYIKRVTANMTSQRDQSTEVSEALP